MANKELAKSTQFSFDTLLTLSHLVRRFCPFSKLLAFISYHSLHNMICHSRFFLFKEKSHFRLAISFLRVIRVLNYFPNRHSINIVIRCIHLVTKNVSYILWSLKIKITSDIFLKKWQNSFAFCFIPNVGRKKNFKSLVFKLILLTGNEFQLALGWWEYNIFNIYTN